MGIFTLPAIGLAFFLMSLLYVAEYLKEKRLREVLSPLASRSSLGRVELLSDQWWAMLARGWAALVFVAATFRLESGEFSLYAAAFAVYCFIDGVFSLITGSHLMWSSHGAYRKSLRWGISFALLGAFDILMGAHFVSGSSGPAAPFYVIVGMFAIARGALETSVAVDFRDALPWKEKGIFGSAGLISAIFGLLLCVRPMAGGLEFDELGGWNLISLFLLVYGAAVTLLGMDLKSIRARLLADEEMSQRLQKNQSDEDDKRAA